MKIEKIKVHFTILTNIMLMGKFVGRRKKRKISYMFFLISSLPTSHRTLKVSSFFAGKFSNNNSMGNNNSKNNTHHKDNDMYKHS